MTLSGILDTLDVKDIPHILYRSETMTTLHLLSDDRIISMNETMEIPPSIVKQILG